MIHQGRARKIRSLVRLGSVLLLPLGSSLAQSTRSPARMDDSASVAVVRSYFVAYNAHDVEGVVRLLSPDFVWLTITGDSVTKEAEGAAALRRMLTTYFAQLPSARSEMETVSALGPWVSVRERAHWTAASGARSQASMSMYEVRAGVLRRVWYYPEVR